MAVSIKRVVFGTVIIGSLTLLIGYFVRQFSLLTNSCYAVTGVVLHQLGIKRVKLTLLLKLQNKSDITIKITRQEYDIFFNDLQVAHFATTDEISIISNAIATLPILVDFSPIDLLQKGVNNIEMIISDKNNIRITTKGKITAHAGLAKVTDMPINVTMSLKDLLAEESPQAAENCKAFHEEVKKQKSFSIKKI